ncbi:GNAT family N-acetyltransferase [Streptomyces cucumeris]|uniref:GNAT family N-acetyltransferase n=1 Tax=Streptomyces cucumeris TaxID=2962890 RepID=UPI003D756830
MTGATVGAGAVRLREVTREDLPVLFDFHRDPEAIRMAAFTAEDPGDREAFDARWERILDDDAVLKRTVLYGGRVAGNVMSFEQFGDPSVGYWIGREHWGRGVATRALAAFLELVPDRPLYARAAKDNTGSLRVLEKCGFTVSGEERGYASARGTEIDELVLVLR